MFPHPALGIGVGAGGINLIPFKMLQGLWTEESLRIFIINVGGNIFLFVPFGFLLPWRFRRIHAVYQAAIIGACFSTCIEVTQLLLLSNRFTDIDDIILNTFGTIIGYLLYKFVKAGTVENMDA